MKLMILNFFLTIATILLVLFLFGVFNCAEYYEVSKSWCYYKCMRGLINKTDGGNIYPEIVSEYNRICRNFVYDEENICVNCQEGLDCDGATLVSIDRPGRDE